MEEILQRKIARKHSFRSDCNRILGPSHVLDIECSTGDSAPNRRGADRQIRDDRAAVLRVSALSLLDHSNYLYRLTGIEMQCCGRSSVYIPDGNAKPDSLSRGANVSTYPEYVSQPDCPAFLREQLGLKISLSTIRKRFMPAAPNHPKPDCYWGVRPLYKPQTVLDWARANLLSPTRREIALGRREAA